MGKRSRDKGARGEREVKDLHNEFMLTLGYNIQFYRNSSQQADGGGYDLTGLPFLAIEIKHCEQFSLPSWWEQTLKQCKGGQIPVLWYRRNRIAWRIRMPAMVEGVEMLIDVSVEDYFKWLKQRLQTPQLATYLEQHPEVGMSYSASQLS